MDPRAAAAAPWRPAADARALLCWSDTQLAGLAGGIEAVLAGWAAAWGLSARPAAAVAAAEPVTDLAGWCSLQRDDDPAGWLQRGSPPADRLAQALFPGATAAGPLALAVAAACERDALRRLLAAFGVAAGECCDAPGAAACGPWSGAVAIAIGAPLAWQLVLQAPLVAAWCEGAGLAAPPPATRPPARLASLLEALAQQTIALDVRLDGCELDVGSLQALRPGDIVRMRHRIEDPAIVTAPAGEPLFRAYLGRRDGLKAVELAASPTGSAACVMHEDLP